MTLIFDFKVNLRAEICQQLQKYLKQNIGFIWDRIQILTDWDNGFTLLQWIESQSGWNLEYISSRKVILYIEWVWNLTFGCKLMDKKLVILVNGFKEDKR